MDQEKLARLLGKIPVGVFNLLYVGRRIKIDGQMLNAKAQFLCKVVDKQTLPASEDTVENEREQIEALSTTLGGDYIPLPYVEDFTIPGDGGPIPVRLYKPTDTDELLPVLIGFHGGGFIRGSVNSHDGLFRRLVSFGNFAVLSVDYRLAPEHKFPAAVDDAYKALTWVQENGPSKGLDPKKIAIGGDSSGGNLAAVACQDAKRNKTEQPLIQVLIYPTTDSHFTANSHKLFAKGFFLTEERMHWYRDLYLNSPEDMDNPRASPLVADDVSGLAPALIISAGFDPLRDEAEDYAKRLKDAGVPVGMIRFEGMIHGFSSLSGLLPDADKSLKTIAEAVSQAFQNKV
ncbi:alpha/beta hydrolase [Sneathiella limimaris]|uniref:alpha/beta hydrolase n=1 Tax=Sneathiella limimaris TaxID=1964213 RepID=UPI00146DF98B|nr:alpha/beta hydrolase [Sneathiella limimaris]